MKNILVILTIFFAISLSGHCQIEKIEFSKEGQAKSADYDMIIYANHIAIYHARSNNYSFPYEGENEPLKKDKDGYDVMEREIKGLFMSSLDKKTFNELTKLILSMDDEFAKGKYFENSIHASVGVLKVTYQSGEIRSINDYGLKGTDGLIKLYKLLDDLRFSQKWK